MNTRPDERLPYLELARQGARVVRSVQADELTRLAEIAPGRGALNVEMSFDLDAQGRPWVAGSARVVLEATCQRCLEQFDHAMQADFALCIVQDPDVASALAEDVDVLVADLETVTIAAVVEDELILGLPERLCRETPCPYAPVLEYPAGEVTEPSHDNPFQVLSVLKQHKQQ
jgi:uncharacterized protein